MAEERRSGNLELQEALKEFRAEMKEDIKDLKEDLKAIDVKIHETVTTNNKFYFNGFEPHKHVADHHVIDTIIEKVNEDKKSFRKIIEEILKVAAIAAATWVLITVWNGLKVEVHAPIKTEQNAKTAN